MIIKEICFSDIEKYVSDAKKEQLCFCLKTKYFGCFENNILIGFTGIILMKNKAIFKNHYVFPKFRRKGYFKEMFNFSIEYVLSKNIKKIEATCTSMSINHYLNNGFKIKKTYKRCIKVENIQ